MNKKIIGMLAVAGALLTAGSAQAQDRFAVKGTMAFSADRLFGFYGYSASWKYNSPVGDYEFSQSGTQLNLLWGSSGVSEDIPINPHTTPRLSFDYFVIDGLSVGGSIAFATASGERKQEAGPPGSVLRALDDAPDTTLFVFAPRVGYAYMFSDIIGIWPRGGLTYASLNTEYNNNNRDEVSRHLWSLDLEAMLVIVPKEHFAFVVGPVIDFGIGGGYEHRSNTPNPLDPEDDQDIKLHTYGLAAGILGYF